MKALIIAGGVINDAEYITLWKLDKRADLIVCADRGLEYAMQLKIKPDIIVGDFDSYTGDLPENTEIHVSVPEKDDTDTLLAVKLAIGRGCTEIVLTGALGGRFDHTFANVQTLLYAYEQGCEMSIVEKDNKLTVRGKGRHRFGWSAVHKYFSVFSLTEKLDIEYLRGVKYPLENYTMTSSFPIGVSNEFAEDNAYLSIRSGVALVVRS